jgi:hypothetical protein
MVFFCLCLAASHFTIFHHVSHSSTVDWKKKKEEKDGPFLRTWLGTIYCLMRIVYLSPLLCSLALYLFEMTKVNNHFLWRQRHKTLLYIDTYCVVTKAKWAQLSSGEGEIMAASAESRESDEGLRNSAMFIDLIC